MICLKRLFFGSLLLFVVLCFPVLAQDQLTQMSSAINEKLLSLKQQMLTMQNDLISTQASLQQANSDLAISQEEREQQLEMSTRLSSSLQTINEKLSDALKSLDDYKLKLHQRTATVIKLGAVLALLVLLKIVGYILYAKGIKLPRWLDILL